MRTQVLAAKFAFWEYISCADRAANDAEARRMKTQASAKPKRLLKEQERYNLQWNVCIRSIHENKLNNQTRATNFRRPITLRPFLI